MFSRAAFRVVGGDFTMVIRLKRQRENKMTELVIKANLSADFSFFVVFFFYYTDFRCAGLLFYTGRMIL